jgi:hypothetical protein
VTRDELQDIRSRWLLRDSAKSPDLASPEVVAQAATDIERLVMEVQRLEASCHEITLQYARLCQCCSNSGNGLCPIAV